MWRWLVNATKNYCGRLMGNGMGDGYSVIDQVEPDLSLEDSSPIYTQERPGTDRRSSRNLRNKVI